MAHRFDPAASFAFVEPPPSRVVVPGVDYSFMFGPHHAFLTPSIFSQEGSASYEALPCQKHLSRLEMVEFMLDLTSVGLILILSGLAVIFIAAIGTSKKGEGRIRGAGVVMIGPIPLIFGSDMKWASIAIVLAITLIVLTFVLFGV
jgi:uncharacterized protein (TIGR00304 family)